VRFSSRGLAELSPGSSITDGMGRGYLTSRDRPGATVTSFNANAVALRHCIIPGQLRHLQTAIRHQLLKMPKSVAEASSAAP